MLKESFMLLKLATLLKGAGLFSNILSVKISKFILFSWKFCLKLEKTMHQYALSHQDHVEYRFVVLLPEKKLSNKKSKKLIVDTKYLPWFEQNVNNVKVVLGLASLLTSNDMHGNVHVQQSSANKGLKFYIWRVGGWVSGRSDGRNSS